MKTLNGFSIAVLALLSNKATLTLAQYVTTVTVSINNNGVCPMETGIGAFSGSTGSASVASSASVPATIGSEAGGPVTASELHNMNGSTSSIGTIRDVSSTSSASGPATTGGEASGPVSASGLPSMQGSASSTGSTRGISGASSAAGPATPDDGAAGGLTSASGLEILNGSASSTGPSTSSR